MKTFTVKIADLELIERCQKGEETAFTELYHRYAKTVYNSISRLILDSGEAEDILQDVFISVFSDLEKLQTINSFEAWLKRLAINRSISYLRKNKIYFSDVEKTILIDNSDEELVEKQTLEYKIDDLQKAIKDLPTETRTIVNLYLFEDLSQEEIAKLLGMSNVAVRSQYHRAKKKIQQTLTQNLHHE